MTIYEYASIVTVVLIVVLLGYNLRDRQDGL
jgi:hypothetical protein